MDDCHGYTQIENEPAQMYPRRMHKMGILFDIKSIISIEGYNRSNEHKCSVDHHLM